MSLDSGSLSLSLRGDFLDVLYLLPSLSTDRRDLLLLSLYARLSAGDWDFFLSYGWGELYLSFLEALYLCGDLSLHCNGERLLGDLDLLLGETDLLLGDLDLFLGETDLLHGDLDLLLGETECLLGDLPLRKGDLGGLLGDLDLLLGDGGLLGDLDRLLGDLDCLLCGGCLLGDLDRLLGDLDCLLCGDCLLGDLDLLGEGIPLSGDLNRLLGEGGDLDFLLLV